MRPCLTCTLVSDDCVLPNDVLSFFFDKCGSLSSKSLNPHSRYVVVLIY